MAGHRRSRLEQKPHCLKSKRSGAAFLVNRGSFVVGAGVVILRPGSIATSWGSGSEYWNLHIYQVVLFYSIATGG